MLGVRGDISQDSLRSLSTLCTKSISNDSYIIRNIIELDIFTQVSTLNRTAGLIVL